MVRSAQETKSRILSAAYALFWKHGFVRASLDDIAAQAGLTKRTLYQHFRSKDDLMAAVLTQTSELAMQQLQRYFDRPPERPHAMIDALFTQLAQWAAAPRFTGTGFTRVAIELADLPGHPARTIARRHKKTVEDLLAGLLDKAGVACANERAREVMLLWEGSLTLMLIHGDQSYAEAAKRAAIRLLTDLVLPHPPPRRARANAARRPH